MRSQETRATGDQDAATTAGGRPFDPGLIGLNQGAFFIGV